MYRGFGRVDGIQHYLVSGPRRIALPRVFYQASDEEGFGLAIIPFTLDNTTLNERNVGDAVNIEVDITAKYVEKLMTPHLEGHLANNPDVNAGSANT